MRRLCPACVNRRNQLVDPECVVCDGTGYLALGAAAMTFYSPEVVAEAVVLALEAKARQADQGLTLSDDRVPPVREALQMMTTAGLLDPDESPMPPPAPPGSPRSRRSQPLLEQTALPTAPEVAAAAVQEALIELDQVLSAAPCYRFGEDERPNARGLPLLSANGHPSHLARIADPMEPGADTRYEVRLRRFDRRRAEALAQAAEDAARTKARRAQRQQRERIAS